MIENKNMPVDKLLSNLGFSKNEIRTYRSAFELGKARAGEIITHSGLHRNLVYQSLEKLLVKNLIAKIHVRGVAVFEAQSPEALIALVERERVIAEQAVAELKKLHAHASRNIRLDEGVEGVKRMNEASLLLAPEDTVYMLGGSKFAATPELQKYWRAYHHKRIGQRINMKIFCDRKEERELLDRHNKMERTKAKYLPFGIEAPTWFEMYGDTLAVGIPGRDPLIFSMHSREAAESMKQYFEYLWNQKIRVEHGDQALHDAFYGMTDELHPGEVYFVLGGSVGRAPEERQDFFDAYHAYRIKKGVVANLLVYKELVEKFKERFRLCGDPEFRVSHLRSFITNPPSPMQINLFRDKTVMIIHEKDPLIIYFEQPQIYRGFKAYFDELWKLAGEKQEVGGPLTR